MVIYLYSKCSTCQKALQFLEERNIIVVVKEITKEPPSIRELEKMLQFQNGNIKKLLNTSGQLYRQMGLSDKLKEMPIDKILELLNAHGMLIKRPFLLSDTFGLTGFDAVKWENSLKCSKEGITKEH